jgi:hypothetical protein
MKDRLFVWVPKLATKNCPRVLIPMWMGLMTHVFGIWDGRRRSNLASNTSPRGLILKGFLGDLGPVFVVFAK